MNVKRTAFVALVAGMVSGASFAGFMDLTSPDGDVSSTVGSFMVGPATAFDNVLTGNDNRIITPDGVTKADIIYTFDKATKVNTYRIHLGPISDSDNLLNRAPKSWTFEAKNAADGDWTLLDTRDTETGWSTSEIREYACENDTAYDAYRIHFTANNGSDNYGSYIQFWELEYGYVSPYVGSAALVDFAKRVDFTLSDSAKSAVADAETESVPVAVRLSSAIEGFDYADIADGHSDLAFGSVNDDGTVLLYPHEVESWNPKGESVVWVKVPEFSKDLALTMLYGNDATPENEPLAVWNDYVGVWHMTGWSGSEPDATGHGLAGTPTGTKLAEMTSDANAAVGAGRVNQTSSGKYNRLSVPSYNDFIRDHSRFTVSGWFKSTDASGYPRPLSRKTSYDQDTGWEIQYNNGSKTVCEMRGSSSTQVSLTGPDVTADWVHLSFVFNGTTGTAYANGGASKKSGSIAAVKTRSEAMAIGNNSNGSEQGWCGSYDEVRMFDGVQSDDRVKAEYLAMLATTLVAGAATPIDETAPVFETPVVTVSNDGTVSVSITVTAGEGDVYLMVDGEKVEPKLGTIGTDITIGTPFVVNPTIAANAVATIAVYGVNAKGTEVVKPANGGVMNAAVVAEATVDAEETGVRPGTFTVSRASGTATTQKLVVNLSWSGTAEAGKNFVADLPASVTIPEGETSVTVTVTPLVDRETTEATTLVLTIASGSYISGAFATMQIKELSTPAGYNTWVAAADGKASVAGNWSAGRVPSATDRILFDSQFSNANCEWDGGVNGLSATVAEWTQEANYTGTVQIDTVYEGGFDALNVSGDVKLLGGKWTHPRGEANVSTPTYRLKVIAGGDFTLGSGVTVDLKGKGLAGGQKPSGSSAGSHAASGDGYSKIYGNVYAPDMPGSGSNGANNWGGGAFWLEATGAAVVDGTITVRTDEKDSIKEPAAGSVYIKAASCSGSGKIYADYSATGYYSGGYGSGGRVAIILTSANELALPEANVSIHGVNAGGTGGGGGTFFLKTANQTYGTLILDDTRTKSYGARWHKPTAITAIPAGETWTFDAVKIKNYGMLAVPAGTTLNLPNGIASITATSTRQGGILYQGGTINWGDGPYEFAQPWIFQANSNFVFNADVTIKDKGNFGCLQFAGAVNFSDMTVCDITVNGNLTIEQGGCVFANGGGPNMQVNRNSYAYHGGATANSASLGLAYDSVFNPAYPGYTASSGDQAESSSGGGMVRLTVNGRLAVDGSIVADGDLNGGSASGSGGTINITARTLADSTTGKIHANARDNASNYSGGGGRVAVRLTDGTFSDYWKSNILASGKTIVASGAVKAGYSSSAGTVYLQEKGDAEKMGEIIVRNDGNALATDSYTLLPSLNTAKCPSDDIEDYKRANFSVGGCATVRIAEGFRAAEILIESGSALDLNGKTLTAGRVRYDGKTLGSGTYTAASGLAFLSDSAGGGALLITGGGFSLFVK